MHRGYHKKTHTKNEENIDIWSIRRELTGIVLVGVWTAVTQRRLESCQGPNASKNMGNTLVHSQTPHPPHGCSYLPGKATLEQFRAFQIALTEALTFPLCLECPFASPQSYTFLQKNRNLYRHYVCFPPWLWRGNLLLYSMNTDALICLIIPSGKSEMKEY